MKADARPPGSVEGFVGRGFRVAGGVHDGGVLITAAAARAWAAERADALSAADFEGLDGPVLLVLGTGPRFVRPAPELVAALAARGITVEAMDSRAAARTFNLLLAEGREVAAALLPL